MKKGIVYTLAFYFIQFLGAQNVPHGIKLDLNHLDFAKDAGMQTIYAAARNARVVFDGENHAMTELNSRLEFSMMKGLYENCGYRNFIVEMSANRAYYMEQYICKNDTNARRLLSSISSEKYMRFFDYLNDWMQKVSENDRIHIYGLDVERFYDLSLQRLVDHLNTIQTKIPKKLFPTVNAARILAEDLLKANEEYHSDYSSSSKKSLHGDYDYGLYVDPNEKNTLSLADSLTKQIDLFRSWLGSDFETFRLNLVSLQEYFKWIKLENIAQQYLWREEYMGRKFHQILAADTTQKFFGQFGRCHVAYSKQDNDCGWYNYHSVCNKVRTSYFHGDSSKIVSIALFYRDEEEQLSAVDLEKNATMVEEVSSIKNISSKIHLLFDLYDTTNQFVELKKKFRFVLLSGSDVVELPAIRKGDTTKIIVEVFSESSHARKRRFTFNVLGLSFLKNNLTNMQNHIESVNFGNTIKNPTNWYLNHSLGYQHGIFKTEAMVFYSLGNDENLLDLEKGSLHYSAGGAIGSMGVSFDVSNISFDFMADCGVYSQKIKNDPKSPDITSVSSKMVNVVSNSFVYGGHIGCDYHFSDVSIGMSYQMMFQPQDDIWRYQHSQHIYQDFGKINSALFYSVSLLMKLQL